MLPRDAKGDRFTFMTNDWIKEQRKIYLDRTGFNFTDKQIISEWWVTHHKLFY